MTTTVATNNVDIDYIAKDYSSTVDDLISFATVNFGPGTEANRLWTNFNASSFSRNWLEIVAYIADIFFFYFDTQASQSYLQTATVTSAINNIATQFGFTPSSASSASGNATFTVTGAGTIPRGFQVANSSGVQFYITNDIICSAAGQFTGTVLQGTIVQQQFTCIGLQSEEFNLTGPNVIVDNNEQNPLDLSPQVTVNGNAYTLVSSFIRNNGTDTPAILDSLGNVVGGGRVFTLGVTPSNIPFITFGDGIFGRKVAPGETVIITYRTGGGSAGNIQSGTLTTLVSSLSFITSVTNASNFAGGADVQTLDQLRALIPASLRTLERAVTEQDYSDLILANFPQVLAVSAAPALGTPGVDIDIYVVPQGNSITAITTDTLLYNELVTFIDTRKMVTTQFQILDAYGVSVLIYLDAYLNNTTSQSVTKQAILTALQNFFNLSTGGVNGAGIGFATEILVEQITNVIETIPGIARFEIKELSYRPRVQINSLGLLTTYSVSNVTIFPNITSNEWLIAAAGEALEPAGTLYNNSPFVGYTYNASTGLLSYIGSVNLSNVSSGDVFTGQTSTIPISTTILGVNTINSTLYLSTGLTILTSGSTNQGSITSGLTGYESFRVFKKILATATNLSVNSITDNSLDLSVDSGTAVNISPRVIIDNNQIFIPNQYSTPSNSYFFVDSSSNIWNIVSNTDNMITLSITAINDPSISTVTPGTYQIVRNLAGSQILFNNQIDTVEYNTNNTLYSIGAEFIQIGTIGNSFQISQEQANIGNLGIAVDIIGYNASTKQVTFNGAVDLSGVNTSNVLVDSANNVFNIVAVDNRGQPAITYPLTNHHSSQVLTGSGPGVMFAEGFIPTVTSVYSAVAFWLRSIGNAGGYLTAEIVNTSGSLPDLTSVVAVSNPIDISTLASDTTNNYNTFDEVVFDFPIPPTLNSGTLYHLVIYGDVAYATKEQQNTLIYPNLVPYTVIVTPGIPSIYTVSYTSSPNLLSNVTVGDYFYDGANYFKITNITDVSGTITIENLVNLLIMPYSPGLGNIVASDYINIATDNTYTPSFPGYQASSYNGLVWSYIPGTLTNFTSAIFTIQAPNSVTISSNLTPVVDATGTISSRYYDDNREFSVVIGLSSGNTTVPDAGSLVNAYGKAAIDGIPNSTVDTFVFRSSDYLNDIINLRPNEIPTLSSSDVTINLYGGIA